MIVLDSSVVIALFSGSADGDRLRELLSKNSAAVSTITVHEVLVGLNPRKSALFEELLAAVDVLPFDHTVARQSVAVEHALLRKGTPIGKLDTFIAATCLVHRLPLLTLDKAFANVDGLKLVEIGT